MKKVWNSANIEELNVSFTASNPTEKPKTWDGVYYDDNGKPYSLQRGETPSGNSIEIPAVLS